MPELLPSPIPAALMLGLLPALFNGALVAFAGATAVYRDAQDLYSPAQGRLSAWPNGTTVIQLRYPASEWIGNDYLGPVPWLVVIALMVVAVCWFILRRTTLAFIYLRRRQQYRAARLTGIRSVAGAAVRLRQRRRPALRAWRRHERLAAMQRERQPRRRL